MPSDPVPAKDSRRARSRRSGAGIAAGVLVGAIAGCLLNPITEEIPYRGVLVRLLRHELALSLPVTVVLALGMSVVAHLYQGVRFVPFHHGTALAIASSPAGLAGCIALHAAGDVWPLMQAKRDGGSRSPREPRHA